MWLFNDLPIGLLQERYGFDPTDEWAQHIMLSSVRFNSGGSASFVSSKGLVLTNHHVAADTLHKLSTPEHNYVETGFLAKALDEEIPAPDLELNQVVSIDDVTERVNAVVKAEMSTDDAFRARRAVMAEIETESLNQTGLRSDVVTLFGGAKYHLYRYKKYTDVRLVWAPETKAAFFGGDPDNFEYPRYCLDATLFRVYEDGKPAEIEHFLRYSEDGPADGELVFVSGNPGRTQRIFTVAALKYLRDKRMPYVLNYLRRLEILMQQFGFEGDEQERRARDELFGIQNSRKAYTGMLQGLQNPVFLKSKEVAEAAMLEKLNANSELQQYSKAWETIEDVQRRQAELLGQTASFNSQLYSIAETLVLMAAEDQKPSGERLREFRDSARESLEQELYSPAPIYDDLELVKLADSLGRFVELRGGDDPFVAKVLNGQSPRERAAALIQGSQLAEVDVRHMIADGGPASIEKSDDLMIELAKIMEDEYRRLNQIQEELGELERQAYAQITEAKVALMGASGYPDATFTLRLAFGRVAGYIEDGTQVPPWTGMAGAFEHEDAHGAKGDWVLPKSWHQHKDNIALDTPLNFVCTADIIGGNSGSPVVNREGELVGLIFDGNIQSLTADYFYSDEVARAVAVHSSAIREALRSIYDARDLAEELGK
ncbi:MAG: S46 family peptidase [Planctomycetaceae bacterium]|nr:S46 family peptidase [Planctomycetaceae bacterium]